MDKKHDSLKYLFQQEFAKMVAVISRLLGLQYMDLAEDIVSETFLQAAETWGIKGQPPNPPAWLYAVARQKTFYHFRRNKIFQEKVIPAVRSGQEQSMEPEDLDFSPQQIKDSQLQMLFAVCNPAIASEAQIGLALRILCGFGIDEIAEAFLSNKETINKRLFRAKEKLRAVNIKMELPPEPELVSRIGNVLHIIYLLFSEGYYSKTQNPVLRKDLCLEAMRLGMMLTDFECTNLPATHALIALMCFHASRFSARQTDEHALVLYDRQDETLWDQGLIRRGMRHLNLSAEGSDLTTYHLEARIAYWHCIKEDTNEKWEAVLELYDHLLLINYSPGVALNRIYALYKMKGAEPALKEAAELTIDHNHFYFLLLGALYKNSDQMMALTCLQKAYALAKTQVEKEAIQQQIDQVAD
jgi:RNA polymerase sigma-70 factor (ECF subfamily)